MTFTSALVPATTYPAIVGRLLAQQRKAKEMKQEELAEKLDIKQSALSKLERGEVPLTIEQLAIAAGELSVRPGDLLQRADRVVEHVQSKGVAVRPRCDKHGVSSGWVLIGALALAGLIGAALGSAATGNGR